MKTKIFTFLILISVSLFSHNHWIYVDNYSPARGEKINLEICSGHKFPKSSYLLKKKFIKDTFIKEKASSTPFYIEKSIVSWKSGIVIKSKGRHTINFSLKKRSGKGTLYRGKAIIFSGKNISEKTLNLTGEGLELQLYGLNSNTKAGDKCNISTFFNGKKIKFNCTVIREGGKPLYLNSNKEKFAEFTIKKPGLYLITVNYKGKGSSLTFMVR
ncbi:MAG: hypothetical protein ABFR75_04185 [Acidobacteriota bacterium]